MKHALQISVATTNEKHPVLSGRIRRLPKRLLTVIFGEFSEVLVLTPGKTVQSVEIHEASDGGESDGSGA